jgi:hypothetical protein
VGRFGRVAHDNRHAGAENAGAGQPAMGDRERGETKIRLGLATASRKEQQVDDLAVGIDLVREPR